MDALERKGFAKIGDYLDWHLTDANGNEIPQNRTTVVKVVPVEKYDPDTFWKSLTENQSAITGENLLDDPARQGKFNPKMIYVFEQ